MSELLRAFAQALVTLFHPRMLWLTVFPFLLAALFWGGLFWIGGDAVLDWVRIWLEHWSVTQFLYRAFGALGIAGIHMLIVPFVVLVVAMPLIAVSALLLIAGISMPAVVKHLCTRQFAALEALHGGSWYGSIGHSLGATLVFLVLMLVSLPLWLIPPLFALVPPLLWGWLAYRVMTYDALAAHATRDERRAIVRAHRLPLLAIGVVTGLLGSLPTLLWASSVMLIVLFPVAAIGAIWLYVLIFVFSALWFAHYCLRALQRLRARTSAEMRLAPST
jgi:hypothetical protein